MPSRLASGGRAMMEAARETLERSAARFGTIRPKLLAVTLLTSLDDDAVRAIAYRVRDAMRAEPTARDVNLEWDEPAKVMRLRVDQARVRALVDAARDRRGHLHRPALRGRA